MSDLLGGGPSASAGNGRSSYDNGSSRQNPPNPTGSPAGIRGPRAIMMERAEREARRKAEQQQELLQMERIRAEEEQRLLDEERRRSAERRAVAARAAGGGARGSGGDVQSGLRASDNSQISGERVSGSGNPGGRAPEATVPGRGSGGRPSGGAEGAPSTGRPARTGLSEGQSAAGPSNPGGPQATQGPETSTGARRPTQSTFPHAFERWETLSAHWEGLTSYWMRRLEENSSEIQRDPLSTQLARQVTDLSAAGANLFHAVVELQRLRASSERKFQRWFFDTRQDQERAREIQAMLENSLQEERLGREEAIADAVARENSRSNSDRVVAEMKRELQISKEEARRAWEELGRREQDERERTLSLKDGHPTLVGGVQVVPMMPGGLGRHTSAAARDVPPNRGGQYPEDEPEATGQRKDPSSSGARTTVSGPQGQAVPYQPSSSASFAPYASQAPAVQPPSSGPFYQQPGETLHRPDSDPGTYSEGEYEIDAHGHFRRDSQGNRIRYGNPPSDDDTEEEDASDERAREIAHLQHYGHAPVSGVEYVPSTTAASSRPPPGTYLDPGGDYAGQGYGSGRGWEEDNPHHFQSRLSDVLEEDERSRTSASQISRRE